MKFNSIINNFSSGAWSPKMISRADTEEYFKSCTDLENMIPQLHGGVYRRPGLQYITNVKTVDSATKIIPWRLSTGETYLLYVNGAAPGSLPVTWYILNTATGATTNLSTTSAADYADATIYTSQTVQIGDMIYMTSAGGPPRFFKFIGGVPYVLTYHEQAYFTYSGALNPWQSVPYKPIAANGIDGTITVTGTFTVGGAVTVTSSLNRFAPTHVPAYGAGRGLFIKVSSATSTGVIEITGYTNAASVSGVVRSVVAGASPVTYGSAAGTSFEIAAWNGADGWPLTIAAFQQRLYFGGNTSYPDTIWGSRVGTQLDLMEVPFQQDSTFATFSGDNSRPWSAAISTSNESYSIQSMISAKTLEIHTVKSDVLAYGSNGQVMGPLNKQFESSTSFGSDPVQPVRANNYSTFVQRGGRKLRDMVFSFNEDQYKSTDLMFMADHYTFGDFIYQLASFEYGSTTLILAKMFSGNMYVCAIDRDYKMNAWHKWIIGGTDVKVKSMAVLPTAGLNRSDAVYFIISRTINGSTVYSTEKLSDIFEGPAYDFSDPISPLFFAYLDSFMYATNPTAPTPNVTHNGLSRLEGQSVSVIADSYYIGEFTVTGGAITLPKAYIKCIVGLPYQAYVKTSPIAAGAQFGSAVSQVKTARRMIINLFKTLTCQFRTSGTSEWFDIPFREQSVASNVLTPAFTGDKVQTLPTYIGRNFQVEFKTSVPMPMNITSIVLEGVTND